MNTPWRKTRTILHVRLPTSVQFTQGNNNMVDSKIRSLANIQNLHAKMGTSFNSRLIILIFGGFSVAIFLLFSLPADLFLEHEAIKKTPEKKQDQFVKPWPELPTFPLSDLALSESQSGRVQRGPSYTGLKSRLILSKDAVKPVAFSRGSFVLDKAFVVKELQNYSAPTTEELSFVLQKEKGFDMKPPDHFLTAWKNPCWKGDNMVGGTYLKCLPYFYILGFPKCATTDLWQKMKLHPAIEENVPKETHWWSRLRYNGPNMTMSQYYAGELFGKHMMQNVNKSSKSWVLADGSPSYVYEGHNEIRYNMINGADGYMHLDPPAPRVLVGHLIKQYTPKAKFVLMLRNPTDRIFSHHVYFGTKGYKRDFAFRRSPRKLHYLALRMINLYKQCFSEKPMRQCMYDPVLYRECEESKVRLDRSMYSFFISDWLKIFPREQFFIITLDEYSDDNKRWTILKELFKFLELPPVEDNLMKKMVTQKRAVAENKDPAIKRMLKETRSLLNDFFRPFNEALVDLLGDEKFLFEGTETKTSTRKNGKSP
ncbi:carbohydrate sulfotransferase 15-like [Lineus longissimus]|uniref:carbohydrate sulfotransferase 15-like n=1 Tax=Lineus longissimus TaxID=88925 RepID=UPI002B4CDE22